MMEKLVSYTSHLQMLFVQFALIFQFVFIISFLSICIV